MKKKPRLNLTKLDEPSVIDVARLYEKLTGKKMSTQDIAYAESKFRDSGSQ